MNSSGCTVGDKAVPGVLGLLASGEEGTWCPQQGLRFQPHFMGEKSPTGLELDLSVEATPLHGLKRLPPLFVSAPHGGSWFGRAGMLGFVIGNASSLGHPAPPQPPLENCDARGGHEPLAQTMLLQVSKNQPFLVLGAAAESLTWALTLFRSLCS